VAGAAAGVQAVFEYNQKNFKYDREMRQKTELKIREWRKEQAGLWRDDIREIIGLTEKKMDSYLLVGTLELGMCVVLFCEGRLEPGTPPWLMHFYMLTTSCAFLYLLMAVWLAMHASIVAQCSSVRILTQYVRLPVPTYHELQDMRTYAQSYEKLESGMMMRLPFQKHAVEESSRQGVPFAAAGASKSLLSRAGPSARKIDPWHLEEHSDEKEELYELMQMPADMRRHIALAKRASSQYQSCDAFARTALSFGTQQLLSAVAYYCLGYVCIQDGAPWPAICVSIITVSASLALCHLDFSFTRTEQAMARVLIVTGPMVTSLAAWAFAVQLPGSKNMVLLASLVGSFSHALWLVFALKALGVEEQPNGSMLPMKFRAVLYLDVFGWFTNGAGSPALRDAACRERVVAGEYVKYDLVSPASKDNLHDEGFSEEDDFDDEESLSELQEDIREQLALWRSEKVLTVLSSSEKARVEEFARRYQGATGEDIDALRLSARASPNGSEGKRSEEDSTRISSGIQKVGSQSSKSFSNSSGPWLKLQGYSDIGTEAHYLYNVESGDVKHMTKAGALPAFGPEDDESDVDNRSFDPARDLHSISMLEEDVERFCEIQDYMHASGRKKSPSSGSRTATTNARGLGADRSSSSRLQGDAARDGLAGALAMDCGCNEDQFVQKTIQGDKAFELQPSERSDDESEPGSRRARLGRGPQLGEPEGREGFRLQHEPDEDVAMSYGRVKMERLPYQIFRSATLLVAFLWVFGACMPFFLTPQWLIEPLLVGFEEERKLQHHAEGFSKAEQAPNEDFTKMDALVGGEFVAVTWPTHSGFIPRALTCDPTGTLLVVGDDFGIYASRVIQAVTSNPGPPVKPPRTLTVGGGGEGLSLDGTPAKAASSQADTNAVSQKRQQLFATFLSQPPCNALEGHGLEDVGLACAGDLTRSFDCRALVLHDHGHALVECPLHFLNGGPPVEAVPPSSSRAVPTAAARVWHQWEISENWLHGQDQDGVKEYVASLAVSGKCLRPDGPVEQGDTREFVPQAMAGCVVVGTNLGRIVELRSHFFNASVLVPERAMRDWSQTVGQGSLHIFPNGVVAGLQGGDYSVVRAFDAKLGENIGAWRLPVGGAVRWLNFCGGGSNLFVLGRGIKDGISRLYRFDMPEKLKAWQASVSDDLAERSEI